MAIQSGGAILVKSAAQVWSGTPKTWNVDLLNRWVSYEAIYSQNPWVATVIDKIAELVARLPLKVYRRDSASSDRVEERDHPYAALLRRPSASIDPYTFWEWTAKVLEVHGEAFLGKLRDRGGRPVELLPLHPVGMQHEVRPDGSVSWRYDSGLLTIDNINRADLLHFKHVGPSGTLRGQSPLEALRQTLQNEDAARRATTSFWQRGARPGVALSHPGSLSSDAQNRLKLQWEQLASGADRTGVTVVLEEGMKPEILTVSNNEAQYIETHNANRDEIIARFNMPPPAVQVLDRATFSNVVEQFRSLYRDTAASRIRRIESVLEFDLRAGVRPGSRDPDFGEDVYAEFLLEEVLRGDFEQRAASYQQALTSGWLMPSEVRKFENLPFVEGSDRLFVNAAMVPLAAAGEMVNPAELTLSEDQVRTVMGRLSRQRSLDEVDDDLLVAGLNESARVVLAELAAARVEGCDVAGLRERLKDRQPMSRAPSPSSNLTVNLPPVTLDVHVPQQPAPNVYVNVPAQAPPHVDVHVPQQPAPQVEVNVPAQAPPHVDVHVPQQPAPQVEVNVEQRPMEREVVARDEEGRIQRTVERPLPRS